MGMKFTEEHRHKLSLAKKGKPSLKKGKPGHKHTLETRLKIANSERGEKNYNWKGGWYDSVDAHIRTTFQYRQWRSDVYTRDDYTCQLCGERGKIINADHYPKTFKQIIVENDIKTIQDAFSCDELWNINNGRTLCKPCHIKRHKKQ